MLYVVRRWAASCPGHGIRVNIYLATGRVKNAKIYLNEAIEEVNKAKTHLKDATDALQHAEDGYRALC